MNDRLKFRYWHTKENKYIHTQCDCLAICNCCFQSIRDVPDVRGWYNTILDQAYNDFELIPEQCTGLKDKNGNLIYEGDIVKCDRDFDPDARVNLTKEVIFTDGIFVLANLDPKNRDFCYINRFHNIEIIGNIHEQAEQKEQ